MQNDFSKGSVIKTILKLALPMTLAQLINVLYNVVDRIYIGQLAENSTQALTGLGVALPIISAVTAFANLFGMGGAPLFSITRGRGDSKEAEYIMGNTFFMLVMSGIILTVFGLIFKRPLLFLLGASNNTIYYADSYLTIYLLGTIFVMVGLGMNSFINAQGFGTIGMLTVAIGAIANIILDPVFIFLLDMGVQGAALATIISQFISAIWIFRFLTGEKPALKLKLECLRLSALRVLKIATLGMSGFIMSITNSAVQITCNSTLQLYGGDLYVGAMTVINTIREVVMMPVHGVTNSAQPVMGFNYGAGKNLRVRKAISFTSVVCIVYATFIWAVVYTFPGLLIRIFNNDPQLIIIAIPSLRLYFFGFFMMSLQMSGQSVFVGLGKSKQAIFFSLLRKAIIVIPLTLYLPRVYGLGTKGVFLAEPISNFLGGLACYITMLLTVFRKLKKGSAKSIVSPM